MQLTSHADENFFAERELRRSRAAGMGRLALWTAAVAVGWLIVLPWLALQTPVASRLEWLDERRIDPSAMYYTELEVLKPVLQRLNRRARQIAKPADRTMAHPTQ